MTLQVLAKTISFVFHPLLILTYIALLLSYSQPHLFGVPSLSENGVTILRVFMSSFVLPAAAVLMMKWLDFLPSLEMPTREDRTIPLIVTSIFYCWLFYTFYKSKEMPVELSAFMLGSVLGLFTAFFINLFEKISLHTVGMGGLLGATFLCFTYFKNYESQQLFLQFLVLAFIIAGLVGTARLLLGAHEPRQVYSGYLVGICTQFMAFKFLMN